MPCSMRPSRANTSAPSTNALLRPAWAAVLLWSAAGTAIAATAPAKSAAGFGFDIMETVVVTATRAPQSPNTVASSLRLLDSDTIRSSPSLSLDGVLRSVPGFSLFRRSDSLTANPTAQGVSLRGLGPSGASRSLVLLDGVPLNDPFGGWIAWTKVPRDGIAHAEILSGGGATAWGNAALGGVVHLFTVPVRTQAELLDQVSPSDAPRRGGALRFAATVGDFGTRSAEFAVTVPAGPGALQVLGRGFSTDGFGLVAPEHQGSIDIAAWSRHRWLTARWRQPLGENLEVLATARMFDEKRGNGTPYQQNESEEKFASVALAGSPAPHFAWNAMAYAQDQSFASRFSSVDATRSTETPASDQFDVPSTAFGAAWTGALDHPGDARTSFGADGRFVRGETREHYLFNEGEFTRLRVAGGKQLVGGVFALHERALTSTVRATLGARLDAWRETDGHRRESDRATGIASRDDRYDDRDGTSFSPSVAVLWTPAAAWRMRASAQQSFRRPTLNELYRPFRVGPNITEANAALGTEEVASVEIGGEWTLHGERRLTGLAGGRPPASGGRSVALLVLGATAFHNDLRDAVGNVTLARGPGTFPMFGFIGAGGVGRQRLNLDRTRVRGVELSARWSPAEALAFTADYLYNDAIVRRAALSPDLVGKRIAQVPRHSAAFGLVWHAPGGITVAPRLRWMGRQFEDDENELVLGKVASADVTLTRALTAHLELFVTAENVGNARIETGRNSGGLVNTGTPRFVVGGLRGSW